MVRADAGSVGHESHRPRWQTGPEFAKVLRPNQVQEQVPVSEPAGEPRPFSTAAFADEYPFAPHWLDLGAARLHYIDEGQGDVLLFVHGNPTWSFAWRNFVKDLSKNYRVIAIDHVGCGASDKPADYPYTLDQHIRNLVALIEHLSLKQITLFGHDWGGCIGMGAAVSRPEWFRRFVLMNTAAFRSQAIPLRIAVCRIPLLGAVGVRGLNLFSRAALSMAVSHPERMTPAVRAGYVAPYDSWGHRVAVHEFVKDIPLTPSHRSYARLLEVENGLAQFHNRPMLFCWGEQDWCFTTDFLREFQERLPKAETLSLPDAGHYVFEDAWERILPRVRTWLEAT
jgi:pimeloyl-ACP methyl ester carboxylesterase